MRPGKQPGSYVLVAGRHRLDAHKQLKKTQIEATIFPDRLDADLWEIAENLHRAELKALERSLLVGEWVKLKAKKIERDQAHKSVQVGPISKGGRGRKEGLRKDKLRQVDAVSRGGRGRKEGLRAAARELNIPEPTARRAVKIATKLKPKAQREAEKLGLDNNQQVLEQAARRMPENQVAYLRQYAERKETRAAEKERMAAVIAGTAPPENAREAFERWYWDLDSSWQRKVRAWLREFDPAALADYLEQFDMPAAMVH